MESFFLITGMAETNPGIDIVLAVLDYPKFRGCRPGEA